MLRIATRVSPVAAALLCGCAEVRLTTDPGPSLREAAPVLAMEDAAAWSARVGNVACRVPFVDTGGMRIKIFLVF